MAEGELTLEELVLGLRKRYFVVSGRAGTKLEVYFPSYLDADMREHVVTVYCTKRIAQFHHRAYSHAHKGFEERGDRFGVVRARIRLKPLIDFIKRNGYRTNVTGEF